MENLEPYQFWLLLAAVAYFAFRFGRATADGKSSEERRLAENEEIQVALKSVPASKFEEIDRLMADGKKISAVKLLRAETGLGLKLSRIAVEQRAIQQGSH